MANYEEEINRKFNELNEKLKHLNVKHTVFSRDAIVEFCRGFDSPIIGSLEYLKSKTNTHRNIVCEVCCNQLKKHTIISFESFEDFASNLTSVSPPIGVEFVFKLSQSVYPISEVSETFSVYFNKDKYEIVYQKENSPEFRLIKRYMTHIEPGETRELRDLICDSILQKVTIQIDALL